MNRDPRDRTGQPSKDSIENVGAGPWLLRRWRARRRARRLQLSRDAADQRLARRVQDILVGCELSQSDFSIAGGRVFHIPQVISVVPGPPVGLTIRMLHGQIPDDYAAQAKRIAYNLDVADVLVIPLSPGLIRLELVSKPISVRTSVPGSQGRPLRSQ